MNPSKMELARLDLVEEDGPDTQPVAVLYEPGKIGLARARIPQPQAGEVRIKVCWAGICGSDLESFLGRRKAEFLSLPNRLGHEISGAVDALGPGVDSLAVGDHVAVRYVWGAFARYIVCRPFNVIKVPPELPLIEASIIEVMPSLLHAVDCGAIGPDKTVLITGQGVSGLVMTQAVRLQNPKALVVTDLFEQKLELSRKYGASHTYQIPAADTPTMEVVGQDFPEGFDVVIPCRLDGDGMADAIDAAAQNARIVMYGCLSPCARSLDYFLMHRKRLDIFSTEPKTDEDMRRYLARGAELVANGRIDTRAMITHTLPLSEIAQAFELKREPAGDIIHVMVDCQKQ